MNKRIVSVLLIVAFGMVLVYAVGIPQINKSVDVLVTPHSYQDIETEDTFQRCLISETNFKLPCSDEFLSYEMVCNSFNVSLIENKRIVYETRSNINENNIPSNAVRVTCLNEIRVDKTPGQKEAEADFWHNKTLFDIDRVNQGRSTPQARTPVRGGGVSNRS